MLALNQKEQTRRQAREKGKELFEAVRAASTRGVNKRAIARQFGIDSRTVRRYVRAQEFPERAPRRRLSELDSFREYLEKRWAARHHRRAPRATIPSSLQGSKF